MMNILVGVAIISTAYSMEWNFAGVNLALHKHTEQGPVTYLDFDSNRSVDGDTNPNAKEGKSCSHTGHSTNPYWSVDLDDLYILKGVRMYNRYRELETIRDRIKHFQVIGYPNMTVLHDDKSAVPMLYDNDVIDIPVDSAVPFSNITVEIPANEPNTWLTLCEVQVFSVENDCPEIQSDASLVWNIRNGTGFVNPEHRLVSSGTVIDFICQVNYYLIGKNSITCLSNGSYNKNTPTCKEIQCGIPADVNNGYYKQTLRKQYSVGEIVQWNCVDKYKSDQNKTRQCQNSSKWSGSDPICLLISCPFPTDLSNVSLIFPNGSFFASGNVPLQTFVTVRCDEGFKSNVVAITCISDNQWDYLPTCVQIYCDRLEELNAGMYVYIHDTLCDQCFKDNYVYGTTAVAIYSEKSSNHVGGVRKCGKDGSWSNEDVTCDKTETEEHSSVAPSAIGGIAVGTFVIGVAVGLLIAVLIWKSRQAETSKEQQTTQRDSTYCTPDEAGMEETHNYTEFSVQSAH